jgi:2-(1,2-epoxy-1,2-dihydrophenyl)acetyl-CoA isomerase
MADEVSGIVRRERADGVLRIVLDRPGHRNALTAAMVASLIGALQEASVDDSLRVLVLAGAGGNFCAGVDWAASSTSGGTPSSAASEGPGTGQLVRRKPLQAHRVIQVLHDIQLPVVCAVQGLAVGLGLGVALAADYTIASRSARMWSPFTRRELTPDNGSNGTITRRVGIAKAKELLLLGREISGADAAELGLISRAVEDADLDAAIDELVAELAARPLAAREEGRVPAPTSTGPRPRLPESPVDESAALEMAFQAHDFRAGLRAFTRNLPAE